MTHFEIIQRANKHGWRCMGVIFIGNQVYSEMRRGIYRFAVSNQGYTFALPWSINKN